MVLEKVIEQVHQTQFRSQIENQTRYLLKRLKETVEAKRPLFLLGPNLEETVFYMKQLGWVKTSEIRTEKSHRKYYEATQQGIELYQQLVQEGYTFP